MKPGCILSSIEVLEVSVDHIVIDFSLLATLVFLLPPESGEKIGLSITVFLALCVNLLLVAEMMPATSLETPIIGVLNNLKNNIIKKNI